MVPVTVAIPPKTVSKTPVARFHDAPGSICRLTRSFAGRTKLLDGVTPSPVTKYCACRSIGLLHGATQTISHDIALAVAVPPGPDACADACPVTRLSVTLGSGDAMSTATSSACARAGRARTVMAIA